MMADVTPAKAHRMPGFASERVAAGLPMPGVILLRSTLPLALAIDELAAVRR
jgi:hypothetical protein